MIDLILSAAPDWTATWAEIVGVLMLASAAMLRRKKSKKRKRQRE